MSSPINNIVKYKKGDIMMRKIIEKNLTKRHDIIKELVCESSQKYKTNSEAAVDLNLSIRQVQRLKKKFDGNMDSLKHKNSTYLKPKKFSTEIIEHILQLVRQWNHQLNRSNYSNLLYSHARYKIMDELNTSMSYTFFRNLLISNNILSSKIRRKPINNELHLESTANKEIKHGYEWQADGTFNVTLLNSKLNLCGHVIVDAASNAIISIFLDYQETNYGYLNAFKQAFEKYGIPKQVASDKRSAFSNNHGSEERNAVLARIFDDLDISSRLTSNPRSKNKVEGKNAVVKEHILKELVLLNASTLEKANGLLPALINKINSYLNNKFISTNSEIRPMPLNYDYSLNFSESNTRKILANCSISFNNKKYVLTNKNNNKILNLKKGTKVTIYSNYKNEEFVLYQNAKYQLTIATKENTNDLILENQKRELRTINSDSYTINWKKEVYHFINQDGTAQKFNPFDNVNFYFKYSKGRFTPIVAVINNKNHNIKKGYPVKKDLYTIESCVVKNNTIKIGNLLFRLVDENNTYIFVENNTKVIIEKKIVYP